MLGLLWLIPALPFISSLALLTIGARLRRRSVALVGVGAVGLSALLTALVAISFLSAPPPGHAYVQTLWTWMTVAGFSPHIALYLDALALVMLAVVTGVGFFIHLYAAEFMQDEEGYSRFFAYMSLFVASMLVLVLADNLLLLYLGWEGVGLCSYLLIGFWYQDPANGRAARKAFVVTRIGDAAMPAPRHPRHPGPHAACGAGLAAGIGSGGGRRRPAAGRGAGQVGTVAPAHLAARCHGRPHTGERADPRRYHGDRWRLPHRPPARPVHAGTAGAVGGGRHRRRHPADRRL